MPSINIDRLLKLAEETFATKKDPSQLDVNREVTERLLMLHPATISEYRDAGEPVAWVLLIPTSAGLMSRFLKNEITEKELFELTPLNAEYEALYLCSALVLSEYRRKGIAKQLILDTIESIRKDHPVKSLFVWAFTKEGDLLADNIALSTSLPLYKKLD